MLTCMKLNGATHSVTKAKPSSGKHKLELAEMLADILYWFFELRLTYCPSAS